MKSQTMDNFISLSKILKCKYVMVVGSNIYGMDEDFAHLSIISHDDPNLLQVSNKIFNFPDLTLVEDYRAYDIFSKAINSINEIRKLNKSIIIENLHEDEKFKSIISKKASEGLTLFNVNGYPLFISKTLIPTNKSDKVALSIIDLGQTFMGEFVIKKGKNTIFKYYNFLKLF